MERMKIFIFYAFLLFATFIRTGESLKCYVCSSDGENKDCLDPVANKMEPIDCNNVALETQWSSETVLKLEARNRFINQSSSELVCNHHVVKYQDEEIVQRGCVPSEISIEEENEPTDFCDVLKRRLSANNGSIYLKHCDLCAVDGCNVENKVSKNTTAAIASSTTMSTQDSTNSTSTEDSTNSGSNTVGEITVILGENEKNKTKTGNELDDKKDSGAHSDGSRTVTPRFALFFVSLFMTIFIPLISCIL